MGLLKRKNQILKIFLPPSSPWKEGHWHSFTGQSWALVLITSSKSEQSSATAPERNGEEREPEKT